MMKKKTIILIPYPAQGHITPMLKLSHLFSDLGFRPVVVLPEFIHRRIPPPRGDGTPCLSIPDGLDGGASPEFFSIERAMEENMPAFLEELIRKMIDEDGGGGVACLVVDLLASWALDVGRRCGLMVAGFWPAMHATYRVIAVIPELIQDGVISENGCPRNPNAPICLSPNDPTLTANDLPWLVGSSKDKIARFEFWKRTLERSKTLRSVLANTFPNEAEPKTQESTSIVNITPQVFKIGALAMQVATTNINGSLWEEDTSCLGWLDKQNVGSVLYVSFGSWVSPIGEAKISSLAMALEALERPFIWVLGPAWRGGLPEKVVTHGKIVSWAPQVEVLRHPAVGCYLTHCGWNSTMEAIQCKKPLLCYPIAGDQSLNCAYIVSAWRIGVKMEGFGIEEVEDGIRKVVEDKQIIQRIEELSDQFYGKEGSSNAAKNLSTFIQDLGELNYV